MSIKAVENKEELSIDCTRLLAPIIHQQLQIVSYQVLMKYDYRVYAGVLNTLRTKLLEVFIKLDKELGNLDELDVSTTSVNFENLGKIVLNIIYQNNLQQLEANSIMVTDNSTNFKNTGNISDSNVAVGKNITQSLSSVGNSDEIRKLLLEMREFWNNLENGEAKGTVEDALDQIEGELAKETPNNPKFERAIERIRGALQPIKDVTAVTTLLVHTNTLAPLLAAAFGG